MADTNFESLVDRAARPYRSSGRYAWHFARGKLRHDPLFRHLAQEMLPLESGKVLDLGCGRGLLFAWLWAAGEASLHVGVELHGVELRADLVDVARRALGARARIDCGDIRDVEIPNASVIVLADVLQYLSTVDQDRVLEKCARALQPDGVLLLREADAQAGLRFHVTEWTERLVAAGRGTLWRKLQYRGAREWHDALSQLGLAVTAAPSYEGTPFANVLYAARKPERSSESENLLSAGNTDVL
jgi:SAM-dependent methyltransferase